MGLSLRCPRCNSISWLKVIDNAVIHECKLCGHHKVVEEVRNGMVIYRSTSPREIALPRKGTKLMKCLAVLLMGDMTTGVVAEYTHQSNSDTASQLTVLQAKGLVHCLIKNKGVQGGSNWSLTATARKLLNEE